MAADLDSLALCSLRTRALHEVAKLCWGDFGLIFPPPRCQRTELMNHCAQAVKRICETFTESVLPRTLKYELVEALIHFYRGYLEALFFTTTRARLYYLETTDLLTGGPYGAKHFINPTTGYFEELAWAESVCLEANAPEDYRFEVACYFCLEERLRVLWSYPTVKQRYAEIGFWDIVRHHGFFVAVWVYWLGKKLDQVPQLERVFADGFYAGCVKKALEECNEHASRYFWTRCSDMEKADVMVAINGYFLRDRDLFEMGTFFSGFLHFIYSLLSTEDKRDLISYSIESEHCNFWCSLLSSPFYKSVLRDMLTLPFPTANKTYVKLVDIFTIRMVEFPLLVHKIMFLVLWNPLSQGQREEVLEIHENFLEHLIGLQDMDLLETVVQSFSPAVKESMLLSDWRPSGMSALDRLDKTDSKHGVLRYLRLFLVDRDPVTNRWLLRKDAADLIDRFSRKGCFFQWPDGELPESVESLFADIIDNLRGSLSVLHDLLDRVEEEIHDEGREVSSVRRRKLRMVWFP